MTTRVIQLSSLIAEDLRAAPGPALTNALARMAENPADMQAVIDACLSSLAAGEPKRALALLAGASLSPRVTAALTSWAARLDDNWYPGWVGAETAKSPIGAYIEAQPGDPFEETLEQVVSNGPIGMLVPRTLVEGHLRSGIAPSVQQAASAGISRLDALAQWASARGVQPIWQWTRLAGADLMRRAAMPQCEQTLAQARSMAADPAQLALTHLIEGDWYAAPGSSPEAMGWDLAPQGAPSPFGAPDLVRAAAAWGAAEALVAQIGATAVPRMAGALALRRSLGARANGDVDGRRNALADASALFAGAGDAACVHLTAMHLLVADIDDGRLAQHALDLAGGWRRPTHGPIADVIAWAESVGSRSWCVGLGRLLERCGGSWAAQGSAPRARVAYFAALALTSVDSTVPTRSLITAIAYADSQQNLTTNALLRLERAFGAEFADTSDTDAFSFAQKVEASIAMIGALRSRSRGPAASLAADRLELLGTQLGRSADHMRAALPALGGDAPTTLPELQQAIAAMIGDGSLEAQAGKADRAVTLMQHMQVEASRENVTMIDVLVPLARAGAAERAGRVDELGRWLDQAVEMARRPGVPPHLLALALITAQRLDEARAVLAVNPLPDELMLVLALRAEDQPLAQATLARMQAAGAAAGDWPSLLSQAEVQLGAGDPTAARTTIQAAIGGFEDSVRLLLRDPDRLDACDQPDVAALFTTLALTYAPSDAAASSESVDASFEAAEWLRSLSIDEPSGAAAGGTGGAAGDGARQPWQHAAATYAAVGNRVLAGLASDASDATARDFAELDAADAALADAERALETAEPGILLRRATPPARPSAAELRAAMAEGVLLLEYLAVGGDLLGWGMTHDGVRPVTAKVRSRELTQLVRAFHTSCADGRAADTRLSALLLEPFADLIRAHPRVVVVPFGALSLVPFHALRFDEAPLGLTHVLSYAPRAAVAFADGFDAPIAHSRPLIVGDPSFDPALHESLRPLPGSRAESAAVAAALGTDASDVLVGDDATEAAVTDRLGASDLLHISSHGHLDDLSPFASSLVLAGADELTVADITGLSLGTELAVLTGCDTGRGAATLGGDLVGLTRALLRSGVRRTVVSMWPVDDSIAPVLMREFYTGLAGGLGPAQALAGAQQAMAAMSAAELRDAYASLGGDPSAGAQRRGRDLPPEFRDDEELPEPLGGDAERFWASFILVG